MNSTVYPLFVCVNCRASNFITHTLIGYTASYCGVSCDVKSRQYMWFESNHLGFYPQYPTRACDIGCGMKPLAMYPLKRSREMNQNCKHQCGKGLGWSDMVNVSEPSFEFPLDQELPKMLIGSHQKVRALGVTCITWVIRRHGSFGIQKVPKSLVKVLTWNTAMS